jgi:hypothetical protein
MVSRIHNKLHLYPRRNFWASGAILLALLTLAAGAAAFQRSQRTEGGVPTQHKTPHRLRAIALVERKTESGGNVTIHVIPITILANDSFHDASIYESRPRPMALDSGVVYEVQSTGIPVGLVTITNSNNSPEGWVALGRWQAVKPLQAAAKPKPVTPAVGDTDDRPILHREGEEPKPTPTPTPDQTQSASTDSSRPTLHRPGEESPPTATPTPTPEQPQTQSSSGDSDRPVLHRRDESSDQQTSGSQSQSTTQPSSQEPQQTAAEQPPSDDPNRPVLRHRKRGDNETENPVVASGTAPPAPTSGPSTIISAAPSSDPGTQVFVGVSDTQSAEPRSFEFHWQPGEETEIQAKMRKLAIAQLPRESAQANEQAMTNVVIRSFDVDLTNDAVVVITAEVPGVMQTPAPSPAPTRKTSRSTSVAAKAPPEKPVTRYVTVIARVDIDGNPQKLAASVTDSSRLDVAPRLELIDAVDVNGDGQAELLFREYDFDQKTFIVYGVGHGTVTKLFEGASEPIKPKSASSP